MRFKKGFARPDRNLRTIDREIKQAMKGQFDFMSDPAFLQRLQAKQEIENDGPVRG